MGLRTIKRGCDYWLKAAGYALRPDRDGKPLPHLFKRRIILGYAAKYGIRTFVETGTYMGDMVACVRRAFGEIHSIELSDDLHKQAMRRFSRSKNVHLHCGDSGAIIQQVLDSLSGRTLFWLDAHYSGGITARTATDTPIAAELVRVFRHPIRDHVILIDDARLFVGKDSYPTIEQVRELIAQEHAPYELTVDSDIIRLVPRSAV